MNTIIDLTNSDDESIPPPLRASNHGLMVSNFEATSTVQAHTATPKTLHHIELDIVKQQTGILSNSVRSPDQHESQTRLTPSRYPTVSVEGQRFLLQHDSGMQSTQHQAKRQRISWDNQSSPPPFTFSARAKARISADRQRTANRPVGGLDPALENQYGARSQALNEQVFPHIRRILDELEYPMSAEMKKTIEKETSRELCDDSFFRNLDKHKGRLSNRFEQHISKMAHSYITKRILEEQSRNMQYSTHESSSCSEDEIIFDLTRRSSPTNPRSPTTSYSAGGESQSEGRTLQKTEDSFSQIHLDPETLRVPSVLPRDLADAGLVKIAEDLMAHTPRKLPKQRPSGVLPSQKRQRSSLLHDVGVYCLAASNTDTQRPYIKLKKRNAIAKGLEVAQLSKEEHDLLSGHVLHVAFSTEEVRYTLEATALVLGLPVKVVEKCNMIIRLQQILDGRQTRARKIIKVIGKTAPGRQLLRLRSKASIRDFVRDVIDSSSSTPSKILRFRPRDRPSPNTGLSVNLLLNHRHELGPELNPGLRPMTTQLINSLEDSLEVQEVWNIASGDVCTVTWAADGDTFLCGAIAHSDAHNQQYNRPGNLLFGDSNGTIRSISQHKIIRPVIETGENSLAAMIQTQDPWLYTSVVFTCYSNGLFFTASFDKTVKIWAMDSSRTSLELLGSWPHEDNVDFVVASPHHNLVATASQAAIGAVRVYEVDPDHVNSSWYIAYGRLRSNNDKSSSWHYYPATIAFGKAASVSHLLLVGYSPRSIRNDEDDIPDDKKDTGELGIFDTRAHLGVSVFPHSQNVFEVLWHPTKAMFFAATSPPGEHDSNIRTQILIYVQNEGGFVSTRALDCEASDVNDLTLMPIDAFTSYVTASCTNGSCYVWDTAQGDRPIHVLSHGESIEPGDHEKDREAWDVGIMFTAWGQTPSRLYTGSSDGKLKSWDVQAARGHAHVRDVVELPGSITSGAFSPDFSQLLLGDSCGKVYKLGMKSTEPGEESLKAVTRPIMPHREPLPPFVHAAADGSEPDFSSRIGRDAANEFLETRQLVMHPSKVIGVYQGPAYAESGLVRLDMHVGYSPQGRILPHLDIPIKERQADMLKEEERRLKPLVLPRLKEVVFSSEKQEMFINAVNTSSNSS